MIENIGLIDSLIRDSVHTKDIQGASYSFISHDEMTNHYIGYQSDDSEDVPLRPDMIYDLASLTKVIGTTTRIFQLLGDGVITLKDPISKYIPDLSYPEITIENLLMHNSGLPADVKNKHTLNKINLIAKVKESQLNSEPGEKVQYSDLGYILLGWIIKNIDGNLANSLRKNVFKPLDMNRTGYNPQNFDTSMIIPTEYQNDRGGLLCGQVNDYKAYVLNGVSGHAGLFSSLNDLNKFVSMYLNDGRFNNQQIIKNNVLEMLKDHYQSGRTLGWQEWEPNSMKLWHTGFTGTSLAMDLNEKKGFVCLTNRVYPDRSKTGWIKTRRLAMGLFFDEPEVIQ